jgi:hypothetical protein
MALSELMDQESKLLPLLFAVLKRHYTELEWPAETGTSTIHEVMMSLQIQNQICDLSGELLEEFNDIVSRGNSGMTSANVSKKGKVLHLLLV